MPSPRELSAADFNGFPPEAHAAALEYLAVLQSLPLVLAPFMLREISGLDWKLPAERRTITAQLRTLKRETPSERARLLAGFDAIQLRSGPDGLARYNWVRDPAGFIELLTAWLWSSHQTEHFRAVADGFAQACSAAEPAAPTPERLGLVLIGQGAPPAAAPLFARLRHFGVHLTRIDPAGGTAAMLQAARARAGAADAHEFLHWYIDGGRAETGSAPLTTVSYAALGPAREQLLTLTTGAIASGTAGPEALRSLLARLQPTEIGLGEKAGAAALNHFQLSLLTEGSGTQIFATTFVQWAARECIRRAEPHTLLLRFAPRQQAQSMDAMLGGTPATGLDLPGSLVDADEAAWLTFVNMRRLPGATETLRYLVWHEGEHEALAIGPGLPAGTSSATAMDLHGALKLLA